MWSKATEQGDFEERGLFSSERSSKTLLHLVSVQSVFIKDPARTRKSTKYFNFLCSSFRVLSYTVLGAKPASFRKLLMGRNTCFLIVDSCLFFYSFVTSIFSDGVVYSFRLEDLVYVERSYQSGS